MRRPTVASLLLALVLALSAAAPAMAATCTLRVTVPGSTPPADIVYLAGDIQGWVPGSPSWALAKQPDGRWTIAVPFTAGQTLQFKFTRGTWETVEKGSSGEEIANRTLAPVDGATYDLSVATWRDLGTITGHVESFIHAPFLGGRRVWVYLPPGYDATTQRYPVLYMHDGQNLFDVRTSFAGEWRVDEACEALIASGEIAPIIVVGIENGGASRCLEYTPWPDASSCGGGGGDAYLTAVRDVLVPEVDARYRTLARREARYMAGSSLGGLISAYAGYAFDGTFSRVAAVSPSYWWAGGEMMTWAAAQGRPAMARFYQDMGTLEAGTTTDANQNGVDDYIECLRTMRDVLVAQGFVAGADLVSLEAAGHVHNESYWAQRVPNMLRFLVEPPTLDVPGRPRDSAIRFDGAAPCPVRGSARFAFVLPRSGEARLDLHDLAGRRVRRLADGPHAAGTTVASWDGRDDGGRQVPAGLYFARLGALGVTLTRTVVVLDR